MKLVQNTLPLWRRCDGQAAEQAAEWSAEIGSSEVGANEMLAPLWACGAADCLWSSAAVQ